MSSIEVSVLMEMEMDNSIYKYCTGYAQTTKVFFTEDTP